MSNDSEEEDYMSDAVLRQCEDKRPGLVSAEKARLYQKEAKQQKKNTANAVKPKKKLEAEKREEGLASAISSDNKGFSLLAKMGYRPGMSIGKKGEGRKEPVPIEIRTGRGGLGRDTELKRKAEFANIVHAENLKRRQRMEVHRKQTFLQRMSEKFSDQQASRDLYKSQKVCLQLDQQQDIQVPKMRFFWPKHCNLEDRKEVNDFDDSDNEGAPSVPNRHRGEEEEEEDIEDDEADNLTDVEKLPILTEYLRHHHIYCIWCGTHFTDADDMEGNCPGDTSSAHDD